MCVCVCTGVCVCVCVCVLVCVCVYWCVCLFSLSLFVVVYAQVPIAIICVIYTFFCRHRSLTVCLPPQKNVTLSVDDETLLLLVKENSIKMHYQVLKKCDEIRLKVMLMENLKSFFKFGE